MENLVLLGLWNWAKCPVVPDTLCLHIGLREWMSLSIPHSLQDPRFPGSISLIWAPITNCREACLGRCPTLLMSCHGAEEEWQVGHPNRAAVPGECCSVATCPPAPGKIEVELREMPLSPLAVSSDASLSLPEILCAFSDYFFVSFALFLKDPLLFFLLWSSHLC